MSDMYVYMYVCMYVCMYACMYQELLKKPQQIPRVFAHTWRIKLILILILILINSGSLLWFGTIAFISAANHTGVHMNCTPGLGYG